MKKRNLKKYLDLGILVLGLINLLFYLPKVPELWTRLVYLVIIEIGIVFMFAEIERIEKEGPSRSWKQRVLNKIRRKNQKEK